MNAETIERLAIDRAMGELNEDATILLDTYLTEHPEAREWAENMSEICAQLRKTVEKRLKDAAVESPRARASYHQPIRVRLANVGRWAALIAISVGLGIVLGRWSRPQVQTIQYAAIPARSEAVTDVWQRIVSGQEHGFWQDKALALLQAKPDETPSSQDVRTSLWDRYRQFRKERSYE